MPINRLIFILVLVLVMAAATIALVSTAFGGIDMTGLAILSVIALCASFAWRWFGNRNKTSGE